MESLGQSEEIFKVETSSGTIEVRRTINRTRSKAPEPTTEAGMALREGFASMAQELPVETRESYEITVKNARGEQTLILEGTEAQELLGVIMAMRSRPTRSVFDQMMPRYTV